MARRQVSERQQYLNQEYARLRRNLMQRLRRREKAGHKVDWSTLPRKPKKVTLASLAVYEQGNVIQQRTGEFKFKRGYRYKARVVESPTHNQYDVDYDAMIRRNREQIDARIEAKRQIGIDVSRETLEASNDAIAPTQLNYIDEVKRMIESLPSEVGFYSASAGQWVNRDNSRYINFLLRLVDRAVEEEGVERMSWYYKQQQNAIAMLCDAEAYGSDEESVEQHDSALADVIYPSTVTYSMWEEMW